MADKMADTKAPTQQVTEAEQHWLEAKKITHSMVKKLEQIDKDESGSKKLLADLEAVEHLLETLRLACMATTFTDFKFSHKNRVLDRLWHVHTLISTEYKKGLQRHRGHGQIVQFRTIEKQYAKHLKTAQYFYKGFIERLSARYRLRSLQRVAHCLQSGNITINEVIDADEAQLSHELNVACYRTVLHMGDIARYRLNASRQKGHSPDIAMTYYALAQDLMPQKGDAHHQMAVVLAEQRRDFDVVYHFLRSWSVQQPFALAPKNLASEFKKLLQAPSGSRKQANSQPDPYEMFGTWFVRLHANYFKGEEFSSQTELEREVLHRWEALLKKSEQPAYLQKAVLMNIAAYDIALKKVKNEWTEAGSQSCQFILRFMVRTILVLSRVLETEIEHLFEEPASEEEPAPATKPRSAVTSSFSEKKNPRSHGRGRAADADKSSDKPASKAADNNNSNNNKMKQGTRKNAGPETCLALFRVCMAWTATHQEDLVKFREYLAPHIVDMHRSTTRCLTLFIELIASTDASPVPYLLPDDVEVIGLAPLDNWSALRETGPDSPFKPHFDEEGIERKDSAYETLARIYDVVECTVRLVSNPSFPWLLETVKEDGRDMTKILFEEDYIPSSSPSAPITPSALAFTGPAPSASINASSVPVVMRSMQSSSGTGQETQQLPKLQAEIPQVGEDEAPPAAIAPIGVPVRGQANAGHVSRLPLAPQHSSYKDLDDDDFLPDSAKEPRLMPLTTPAPAERYGAAPGRSDAELDFFESAAYSRVENFLSPPELHPHPPQPVLPSQQSSSMSSYGMHSATAEDVFGQLQTPSTVSGVSHPPPGLTAAAMKPIPSSPWNNSSSVNGRNNVYSNPLEYYHPTHALYGMGGGGVENVPSGLGMQPIRPPTNIEEQLAFLTVAKQQERQFAAGAATAAMPPAMAAAPQLPPLSSSSSYGLDGLPSRGFPSSLSPVGAAKQPRSPPGGMHGGDGHPGGFVNPWATGGIGASNHIGNDGNNHKSGAGFGSSPAAPMLYSSNFSMNNNSFSSMPSVQSLQGIPQHQRGLGGSSGGFFDGRSTQSMADSPQRSYRDTYDFIYGHEAAAAAATGYNQMQQQKQQQRGPQLSPSNRSNFGSPFGGGPFGSSSVVGAPTGSPSAAWQDASTAWGRGVPVSKDDPTHFRNAVRPTGLMEVTNAYDRNVLLGALHDGKPAQQ